MVTIHSIGESKSLIKVGLQYIISAYEDGLLTPQERDDLTVLLYFEWTGKIGRKDVDRAFEQNGAYVTTNSTVEWRISFVS